MSWTFYWVGVLGAAAALLWFCATMMERGGLYAY